MWMCEHCRLAQKCSLPRLTHMSAGQPQHPPEVLDAAESESHLALDALHPITVVICQHDQITPPGRPNPRDLCTSKRCHVAGMGGPSFYSSCRQCGLLAQSNFSTRPRYLPSLSWFLPRGRVSAFSPPRPSSTLASSSSPRPRHLDSASSDSTRL